MSLAFHPRRDPLGRKVRLARPSRPSPPEAWGFADAVATVVPDGARPEHINGVRVAAWADAPVDEAGWDKCAPESFDDPDFQPVGGLRAAAGVVALEPCGRVWVVSPSNGFGGYENTFPKGTVEPGTSLRGTARKEAFEETGLQVELTGFLVDCPRSESYTRYYLARRIGGDPALMGWESQAVHLVPQARLKSFVGSPYDRPILEALLRQTIRSSRTPSSDRHLASEDPGG